MAGTGYWATYQMHAWREIAGVSCVGVCDTDAERAEQFARRFDIPAVFPALEPALDTVDADFVDIVASVNAHEALASVAAARGVNAICQKPLASTWDEATAMASSAAAAGTRLLVHENWRFQRPIRALQSTIARLDLGRIFRARIEYNCGFDVAKAQPALAMAEQFILLDMGPHIFDVARYLFGEFDSVYCSVGRVNPAIRGEDVATAVLTATSGLTVTCELSYSTVVTDDPFPQTRVVVEAEGGTITLGLGHRIEVQTATGRAASDHPPLSYSWSSEPLTLVHDSIVACNEASLRALSSGQPAENEAVDNLRSLALVFASYESATTQSVVRVPR